MNTLVAKYTTLLCKSIAALGCAGLLGICFISSAAMAQSGADDEESLDEITVTGRKRDENLFEVPVAISVLGAGEISEAGLLDQKDLFDAVVGIDLAEQDGTRNGKKAGVRGVQSEGRAAHQQKVNTFIDGIPMLGQIATLNFAGVDNIEVYRGPQSAAFGRSTFAGAINYVTEDSSEEFSGKVHARYSDFDQEIGLVLSGPITDSLGYRITLLDEEWVNDDWKSTDGYNLAATATQSAVVKLNFEFSDTAYGEVMYSTSRADDEVEAMIVMEPSDCRNHVNIWRNSRGQQGQMVSGAYDCDFDVPSSGIRRNMDLFGHFVDQYDANIDAYTAAAPAADTNMDGTVSLDEYLAQVSRGKTYETILLEQSVVPVQTNDRDRFQGELNFEIGDGLLQILGMHVEEDLDIWRETYDDTVGVIFMGNLNRNHSSLSAESTLEENYAEVRWVSSADKRLRYTLSGSWYAYEFNQANTQNRGAAYHNLTDVGGNPLPLRVGVRISEETTNVGASFGLQYDLSDSTTLSFEGRFQSDEVCADTSVGDKCVTTEKFSPRIAISKAVGDNHNLYAQFSIGNNPAGNNPLFYDPTIIELLNIANGSIPSPEDGFTYDGSDGVHFPAVTYSAEDYQSYDEEKLTNYEIGSKGGFGGGRGTYAMALYFMDYENRVGPENLNWDDSNPNGWNETGWASQFNSRTNLNNGNAEFYGVEFEGDFRINDIWSVGGHVTLSKGEYTEFCAVQGAEFRDGPTPASGYVLDMLTPEDDGVVALCGIVDGNTVPEHADVTGRLNVRATLPGDVLGMSTVLRADYSYKGSYYEDHANLAERAALGVLNLSANMANENWSARLYLNNVTDEDEPYFIQAARYQTDNANVTLPTVRASSWGFYPRPGREFGIQIGYEF